MDLSEARMILTIIGAAHDRQLPEGLDHIWAATLEDIPYEVGKSAAMEVLKTNPRLPKVAEIREKARLIKANQDRTADIRKQLEERKTAPGPNGRAFTGIYRHVNRRLAEAGQNIPAALAVGLLSERAKEHLLGKKRCALIAEAACAEWLDMQPEEHLALSSLKGK